MSRHPLRTAFAAAGLLLTLSASAAAQEVPSAAWAAARIGDWTVLVSHDTSEAGTEDGAGRAFGFACGLQDCIHYVDLHEPCRDGARYSADAVIADHAFALELTCHHAGTTQQVLLNAPEEEYVRALAAGDEVTVTVRLDSGPHSATFSLRGCRDAVLAAAEALGDSGEDT